VRRAALAVVAVALLSGSLAGCGGGDSSGSSDKTTLVVFAASSLTNTFGELEKVYEKDHPDVDVKISYDSSTTLATQIAQDGAPADVLATADAKSMGILVDAGDNEAEPTPFASNTMAIVTPPDNPADIQSIDDLAGSEFVLCDPSVPCGDGAAQILAKAGVTAQPVSLEDKVTAVLSKVELGEADAGMVYVTDAQGAGTDVHTVAISPKLNVVTPYFIAAVKDSDHADLAAQWIALVSSQAGQGVLRDAGFGQP
jgi:molybdate transport system substrate-binding protein